jgi:diguanylate cyclase (GGDEF)-like protein
MDTVARMGGDEFVFLIPYLDKEGAEERLASIAAIVNTVCLAPPLRVEVSASLGASFYPTDGETAEDLLAVADRRMYQDKKNHYKSSGSAKSRPSNSGAAA